jgi:hypothetical protein
MDVCNRTARVFKDIKVLRYKVVLMHAQSYFKIDPLHSIRRKPTNTAKKPTKHSFRKWVPFFNSIAVNHQSIFFNMEIFLIHQAKPYQSESFSNQANWGAYRLIKYFDLDALDIESIEGFLLRN